MKDRIKRVTREFLDNYVENWIEKKVLTSNGTLIYCKNGKKYLGVDNTTNDCWIEEFNNEKEVRKWLSGIEKEEIILKNKNEGRDDR